MESLPTIYYVYVENMLTKQKERVGHVIEYDDRWHAFNDRQRIVGWDMTAKDAAMTIIDKLNNYLYDIEKMSLTERWHA